MNSNKENPDFYYIGCLCLMLTIQNVIVLSSFSFGFILMPLPCTWGFKMLLHDPLVFYHVWSTIQYSWHRFKVLFQWPTVSSVFIRLACSSSPSRNYIVVWKMLSRTFLVGEPSQKQKNRFNLVKPRHSILWIGKPKQDFLPITGTSTLGVSFQKCIFEEGICLHGWNKLDIYKRPKKWWGTLHFTQTKFYNNLIARKNVKSHCGGWLLN